MSTPLFDVMLTGKIADGCDRQAVITALTRLLDQDARQIADLMNTGSQVVKRNMDARAGRLYLKTLAQAGALGCLIPANPPNAPSPPNGAGPSPGNAVDSQIRVISPTRRPADVAFSPIQANRISSAKGGVDVNRIDTPPIAFDNIALLAAYEDDEAEKIYILVFRHGQKRPYLCDANRIVFTDFPGTKATGVIASLRCFIQFVGQRHSTLRVDQPTAEFLTGRRPAILEIDLIRYTTTLGHALISMAAAPTT